jgi:hypothetical protein
MIQKKALVNIKILLTIIAFGTTNWLTCMEPPKDLPERFLDAATDGNVRDVKAVLQIDRWETMEQCRQILFVQRGSTSERELQPNNDALQLAVCGSQKLSDPEYQAKIEYIINTMLLYDYKRGLKAISGIMFNLTYDAKSDKSIPPRKLQLRQALIDRVQKMLRKLEEKTIEDLEHKDQLINDYKRKSARNPDSSNFRHDVWEAELERSKLVDEAQSRHALINEILRRAEIIDFEEEQRRKRRFADLTRPSRLNSIMQTLGTGLDYINNPMGYLTGASLLCVAFLLSRSSPK